MEETLRKLGIDFEIVSLHFGKNGYFIAPKIVRDKIMICVEIESVEQLTDIMYALPGKVNEIKQFFLELEEKHPKIGGDIQLAQYLWDLYLIGVYKCDGQSLDSVKVAQIERDRFVARKIVLQYTTEKELYDKLEAVILPHYMLDKQIRKLGEMATLNLEELAKDLEYIHAETATFEQIYELIATFKKTVGGEQYANANESGQD